MDAVHETAKVVDRKRYLILGMVLAALSCLWIVGCPATTHSVLNPGEKVDAEGLKMEAVEVEALVAKLEVAQADLQKKQEMRLKAVEMIGAAGQAIVAGQFTPAAGVSAGITLAALFLGAGAIADKKRTDAVLKKKNGET